MEYISAHNDARFIFRSGDIAKSCFGAMSPRRERVLFVSILLILIKPFLISQNKMFSRRKKEETRYKINRVLMKLGAGNEDAMKVQEAKTCAQSASITQLHAGTACSQGKSLAS